MRRCSVLLAALLPAAVGCTSNDVQVSAVRSAECRCVAGPIKLDGVLDEAAWGKLLAWRLRCLLAESQARTATTARLLWDDDYLYFSADMEDADLYAVVKECNGMTWYDDVFEMFLKPSEDKLAYYEFKVNALNTDLELFFPSRGAGGYGRFAPLSKLGMESAVHLDGTLNHWEDVDKGWTVEGRIPWTAFQATGGRPKPGDKWRFALCRYDYSATLDRPASCRPPRR